MNVYWTLEAEARMRFFVDLYDTEVGGFATAMYDADSNSLIVSEPFLIPQEVSAGEVSYDDSGLAFAIERFGDKLDDPKFMAVAWHSHVNMDTFWSTTDEDLIERYAKAGIKKLMCIVMNKKQKYKCRVDFFDVMHHGMVIPQVTQDGLKIDFDPADPAVDHLLKEADANVTIVVRKPKVITPKTPHKQLGAGTHSNTKDGPELGSKLDAAMKVSALMKDGVSKEAAIAQVERETEILEYMTEFSISRSDAESIVDMNNSDDDAVDGMLEALEGDALAAAITV